MKFKKQYLNELKKNRKWKEDNKKYIIELQRFFDRADNVIDKELKTSIIAQMLRCDKALTEIAEDMFDKCYKQGYNEANKDNFKKIAHTNKK